MSNQSTQKQMHVITCSTPFGERVWFDDQWIDMPPRHERNRLFLFINGFPTLEAANEFKAEQVKIHNELHEKGAVDKRGKPLRAVAWQNHYRDVYRTGLFEQAQVLHLIEEPAEDGQ